MARKGGKRYRYRTNTQDIDWQEERADASQNIGEMQRLFSAIAGMGLIMHGLRRRSLGGGALAVGGVSLLYRAATGYCPAFGAMGIDMGGMQAPTGWADGKFTRDKRPRSGDQLTSIGRPLSSIVSGARSIIFHEL